MTSKARCVCTCVVGEAPANVLDFRGQFGNKWRG